MFRVKIIEWRTFQKFDINSYELYDHGSKLSYLIIFILLSLKVLIDSYLFYSIDTVLEG